MPLSANLLDSVGECSDLLPRVFLLLQPRDHETHGLVLGKVCFLTRTVAVVHLLTLAAFQKFHLSPARCTA